MKYYSESLGELFDSTDALEKAESAHEQKVAEAKAKAEARAAEQKALLKEKDEAWKKVAEAYKTYTDLLEDYEKKYNSFHEESLRDFIRTIFG